MYEQRMKRIGESIKKEKAAAAGIREDQRTNTENLKLVNGFLKEDKKKLVCNLFFRAVHRLDLGKPQKLDLKTVLNRTFSTLRKERGRYAPEFEREIPLSEKMKETIFQSLWELEGDKRWILPGSRENFRWVVLWDRVGKEAPKEDLKKFYEEAERLLRFFAAERERLKGELERAREKEEEANKRMAALELEKEAIVFEEKLRLLEKEAEQIEKGGWGEISKNLKERTPAGHLKEAETAVEQLRKRTLDKERKADIGTGEKKTASGGIKELAERLAWEIGALEKKAALVHTFMEKLGAENGFWQEFSELKTSLEPSFQTEEFRERMARMQEETEALYLQINALNKIGKKHPEIELWKLKPLITEIAKKRNYDGMERLVRLLRWVIKYERRIGYELPTVVDLISRREYEKAKEIVNRHKSEKETRNESEIEKGKDRLGFKLVSDQGLLLRLENLRRSIGGDGINALLKKGKVEYRANHNHTLSGTRISLQRLGFKTGAAMKADSVSVYLERSDRKRLEDLLELERKIKSRNAELPDKELN